VCSLDSSTCKESAEAKKALRAGHTLKYNDGRVIWRERIEHVDLTKTGSAAYQWNANGDRIRADLIEVTRHPNGRLEKQKIRTVWIGYK